MDLLYKIILAILVIYLAVNAYMYLFQRSLLYLPAKEMMEPRHYGLYKMQEVTLTTKDGVNITAWYAPAQHNAHTMLYLHGNAGNLGDRTEKITDFLDQGFGMLVISWRGFGTSGGSPTEEGLYNDARAGLKFLKDNDISLKKTILYGESLGSGVAVQMATEVKPKALVLEAPYTSIADRAANLYPYLPVRLLLKDKFDSLSKIKNVNTPLLVFHGYLDDVMPIGHSRRLMEAASEPKEARFFEHVGHTDFNYNLLAKTMYEFVNSIGE